MLFFFLFSYGTVGNSLNLALFYYTSFDYRLCDKDGNFLLYRYKIGIVAMVYTYIYEESSHTFHLSSRQDVF